MYKIVNRRQLAPTIVLFEVEAPEVAKKLNRVSLLSYRVYFAFGV